MASRQQGPETFTLDSDVRWESYVRRGGFREKEGAEGGTLGCPWAGVGRREREPSEAGVEGAAVSQRAGEGRIARQSGWRAHSEACPRMPVREAAGSPAGESAALGKPLQGQSPRDGRKHSGRALTHAE